MHLIECQHCPSSTHRWFVVSYDEIEPSVQMHITEFHSGTGEWVKDDDWAVLTEADVVAQERIYVT